VRALPPATTCFAAVGGSPWEASRLVQSAKEHYAAEAQFFSLTFQKFIVRGLVVSDDRHLNAL